ncbi:energy transducer TonB [Maribellus maritimus]|uniref:energy transducer TonB n=1 Tax=Maribellus maritimus TaxID=2870838 RepID=UPI001EEB2781|nr:energy transducer TonB [Maribellus maritimus]MCG6187769.1 energy transducer TonB [Maribellus maritimus]
MKKTEKKFIKLPEYPGGKEALKKYIEKNLAYPEEAVAHRVEGIVYLVAEINDNGDVEGIQIQKGLGYGCDEEATRLIKNIRFGGVKNQGIRLKTKKRFKINFKLPPENNIHYKITGKKTDDNVENKSKTKNYSYSIQIKK